MHATVIIPTRNRLKFLQEAIHSIESQTFGSWSLIVVDDHSNDGTQEWLRTLDHSWLETVHLTSHRERSAARNEGLARARGDFVLFLDDDDRLTRTALAVLVSALRRHGNAVAAVGGRRIFDEFGHTRRTRHPRFERVFDPWEEVLLGTFLGLQGQTLFRRETLIEVGGWNEGLAPTEDLDLWLRVSRKGPVVTVGRIVLEQRAHRGQLHPQDVSKIEDEISQAFVETLQPPARNRGRHLLEARSAYQAWRNTFWEGRCRKALQPMWATITKAPEVFRSGVNRWYLWKTVAKTLIFAAFGHRGTVTIRRVMTKVRQFLKRDPRLKPEVTTGSARLPRGK
ncbi:MAG: glycosyltransferase [Actinobacteria bacterium]|nr:glycosyltransferase [Actinomycetota bacterium]